MKKRSWIFLPVSICCFVLAGAIIYLYYPALNLHAIYDRDSYIASQSDYYTYTEVDRTETGWSSADFSGCVTVVGFTVDETGQLRITYDISVIDGRFKLILAEVGGTVNIIGEGTSSGNFEADLAPGQYAVKVVGDDAWADFGAEVIIPSGERAI